ncbi:MAG: tetratricopeptide repeat-containing protein, partial [Pirellulales bacterium]
VAAGWAVRDDAAAKFAEVFYARMLEGSTFSDALVDARGQTHSHFRDCNTWAAYQAYGDPDFRLSTQLGNTGDGGRSRRSRNYVIPDEVIEDLRSFRTLLQDHKQRRSDDGTTARDTLNDILEACGTEWRQLPQILAAFAQAYADFGDFERAIEFYQAAVGSDAPDDGNDVEGTVRIKALESLANLCVRSSQTPAHIDRVQQGIERLNGLLQMGQTAERFAMLGSAHKRLARLLHTTGANLETEAQQALLESRRAYEAAWRLKPADDYYYAFNVLVVDLARGHVPTVIGGPSTGHSAEVPVDEFVSKVIERLAAKEADFWTAVAVPEARLLRHLTRPQNATFPLETAASLATSFHEAFTKHGASPREISSTIEQLQLLWHFLADPEQQTLIAELLGELGERPQPYQAQPAAPPPSEPTATPSEPVAVSEPTAPSSEPTAPNSPPDPPAPPAPSVARRRTKPSRRRKPGPRNRRPDVEE